MPVSKETRERQEKLQREQQEAATVRGMDQVNERNREKLAELMALAHQQNDAEERRHLEQGYAQWILWRSNRLRDHR